MNGDSERRYFRPVPCDRELPGTYALAGGLIGFREIQVLQRGVAAQTLPVDAVRALYPSDAPALERLTALRPIQNGLSYDRPRIMGILNVTPDSFSDGGILNSTQKAIEQGMTFLSEGADILDIGGESTRPGASPVSADEEASRVLPVIEGLIAHGCDAPISVDTRNAAVARQAIQAGARLFNDVSALTHDPASLNIATEAPAICLMHAQGDPQTMQQNPEYDDVLLDVYDFLEYRISACEMVGVGPERIIVDPGIGFGKTLAHNMALLRGLSVFQALGCPVMLGVSRKGTIGHLSGEPDAAKRAPGSIAAGLAGLESGAQILRVHDVAGTVQAVRVWSAIKQDEAKA